MTPSSSPNDRSTAALRAFLSALEAITAPDTTVESSLAGLSLALLTNTGDVASTYTYGVCRRPSSAVDADPSLAALDDVPVNTATVFQLASISKPVTAVAALRLVDAGRLSLDEDVNTYLDDAWKLGGDGLVTARMLLAHAAGMRGGWFPGYERGQVLRGTCDTAVPNSTMDVLEHGSSDGRVERIFLPQATFSYSGGGFMVLQRVVECVTGQAFPDAVRDLIFEPLGMVHSSFTVFRDEHPNGGNFAVGHVEETVDPIDGGYHLHPESAAAGMWSTPTDMARLIGALARSHRGEALPLSSSPPFLSADLVHDMARPQFGYDEGALGWIVSGSSPESTWLAHSGANYGYSAMVNFSLPSGQGYVLTTNGDWRWNGEAFGMLNKALKTALNHMGAPPALEKVPAVTVADDDLASLAGVYSSQVPRWKYEVRVGLSHEKVVVLTVPGLKHPLVCTRGADGRFECEGVASTYAYFTREEAKNGRWQLHLGSGCDDKEVTLGKVSP